MPLTRGSIGPVVLVLRVKCMDIQLNNMRFQFHFIIIIQLLYGPSRTLIDHRNDVKIFKNSSGTTSRRF